METASVKVTAPPEEIATLGAMITLFVSLEKPAQERVVAYLEAMFKDPNIAPENKS